MENSPSKLAAKIGSPGFSTHPNGKILYSVGRWDEGSGALGYHIGNNGELSEFTRMICLDGGSAHRRSSKRKISSLLSTEVVQRLFHSMQMVNLVNPPSRNTKADQGGGQKTGFSPSPLGGILSDGKYALIPDLGLDQIVIYKVDTKSLRLPNTVSGNPFQVEDPATCVFPLMGNSFIYSMNSVYP